ncbi:MAG: 50S ribosomal protein L20 [Pigeon pea little leaf phytoplasma]|uniref:Large ribosomal subunit protein bL20 n=1 Tax=Candidatus Phytoplasma fabacearum TaxID=2982628 RepID=A0ABU8ZTR1_9MOLU|nr:50S ribosomal protein L20 ['Bituminaria bituminosa' little leaf phytoplasma]MDV3148678.1 50S ribosomal protein L20 [Pigeon pea little leaf phytoplasma]MDO7983521.1 50S ribosomal protein L20 ['Bituminaria bituminosa' little leaf phytoplasma]MDO8023813.1 50S ribosomal protein L20 ['Bituminaria bituminosa' little leaf phytoplasma]MDO8030641.1 50S ribosomal protein L20 ['Bituminaria bituminosa' little leaf phytoplasma]MDV3154092.1 50S ribosomal protein L20 [Pigeon pea little leaf phytoplasma]
MVKVNLVPARRRRRKKILKLAKGYVGSKSTIYKTAHEQVMRSWQYAYVGRKRNKRDWRSLWIRRINAGCSENGMNYSSFIYGLKLAGVDVNRKILANLIINKPEMFKFYIEMSQKSFLDFQKNKLTKHISKSTSDSKDILESDLNSDFDSLNSQSINKDCPDTIIQHSLTDNIEDIKQKKSDISLDNGFTINLSSLQKMNLLNLRKLAKQHNINKVSKLKKAELIDLLLAKL